MSLDAFPCTKCGACCRRAPQTGWVPAAENGHCLHLQDDNTCGIYETRPQICRDYTTDDCEYEDEWVYDRFLETPEQVAEYAEAVAPRKRGRSIRSPKPPLLPVVS